MIHEIKKLINDEGLILLYYIPFDNDHLVNSADLECRIQGVVHMQLEGELVPIEFFFPDGIKTPEEAFAVFRETARAHVESMKEEAPRIVIPGDV